MATTLNYTTRIPVTQTVGELQQLLVEHGADAIMIRVRDRRPAAVSFTLELDGRRSSYTLPVDVEAMRKRLAAQHRAGQLKSISANTAADVEHAARVAWRVIAAWLAAQLSLVEAGQAALDQVMLPYLHVDDAGSTLYDRFVESAGARQALLGGAG